MALVFRDSLTGRRKGLPPRPGRRVAMYICGPTVYDQPHVGHARTYLYFDLFRRYLRERGIPVRHVMNITDYEDKITERAARLGLSWRALARREEARFLAELRRLEVLPAHQTPRASDFVPDMIGCIRALERTGGVVQNGDGLYYEADPTSDAKNFPVGADFARHAVLEPGRPPPTVDPASHRFLLWRRQTPPAPSWASPWGGGAPGWHLECFAMARRYLEIPVDFHGGGLDLIFPHHYAENVIALSQEHQLFSRRFLHTGFVTQAGAKMSKSLGNLVPLGEAIARYGAPALRWYLLAPRYNTRLEWDEAAAVRAAEEWTEFRTRVGASIPTGSGGDLPTRALYGLVHDVVGAVEDGFGVDRAFGHLRSWNELLGRAAQPRFPRGTKREAQRLYERIGALLGLPLTQGHVGRRSG